MLKQLTGLLRAGLFCAQGTVTKNGMQSPCGMHLSLSLILLTPSWLVSGPTLSRWRQVFFWVSFFYQASATMYAFSLPQEKHTHALWLPRTVHSPWLLPCFPLFFLGIEKRKIHLFSAWSFQEFALEAVGPGFAAGRQSLSDLLASLLLLENCSCLWGWSGWLSADLKAYPKSRDDCSVLMTKAIKILSLSQINEQQTKQQPGDCCLCR